MPFPVYWPFELLSHVVRGSRLVSNRRSDLCDGVVNSITTLGNMKGWMWEEAICLMFILCTARRTVRERSFLIAWTCMCDCHLGSDFVFHKNTFWKLRLCRWWKADWDLGQGQIVWAGGGRDKSNWLQSVETFDSNLKCWQWGLARTVVCVGSEHPEITHPSLTKFAQCTCQKTACIIFRGFASSPCFSLT